MDWEWLLDRPEVVALRHIPGRDGALGDWPAWLTPQAIDAIRSSGIARPWRHQSEFAAIAHAGRHAAICTPTGSGKSLAYLMPVIAAASEEPPPSARRLTRPRSTAIHLAPTKALAHDQYRAARRIAPEGWRVATLDGDSDQEERRYARDHANLVFTNPDMLHFSVLPQHERWGGFLADLRFIVLDEAHRYQGIFGAHVAQVLRRLRRIAALHGADPAVLVSSATMPNAASFAGQLIGEPEVAVVDQSTAPTGGRSVALWQPASSLRMDTAEILATLSDSGAQTLAFVSSRAGAELVSVAAQELAAEPERIASYRGGYLALDRRELEAGLQSGRLTGLATTNALELGIDVAGVAAVLVSGYPGKLSSFWQQAGRAGRTGQESLVLLLARENPLDAYLLSHPELLFDAPVENAVLHPANPHVLGPHLAAAAQEYPLGAADERWFGPAMMPLLGALADQRVLRDRGGRWFWTRADRAVDHISLRAADAAPVEIIERDSGRVLGVVDQEAADRTVHPGAIYLHQGDTWAVTALDAAAGQALVTAARPRYYTQPQSVFEIDVLRELRRRDLGATELCFGDVQLTSQVTGYLRRDETTHDVLDVTPLDMPQRCLRTQAVWWSVPGELEAELRWPALQLGAAAHAMEHTAIGLLPAFAPCDRWDIGGVSTPLHPATGTTTVFVHDGMAGGAGFAARAFDVAEQWLGATLERLETCTCDDGCPACIVSPKCGNANQVLNRPDATYLLRRLLGP